MTDHSQYRLRDDILLDARRAVWLEGERVLAVSDLHLGYVWAQRQRGALLPLTSIDDTIDRLAALCMKYNPARLVLLGDIVHRALPLPEIESALTQLVTAAHELALKTEWILGNHDRNLEKLLRKMGITQALHTELQIGKFRFTHGDAPELLRCRKGEWLIIGHEHPAISLGDGIASHVKCPCFLASDTALILPAFSCWAAGTSIHSSHWNCRLVFSRAIAICDNKLLPVDLEA